MKKIVVMLVVVGLLMVCVAAPAAAQSGPVDYYVSADFDYQVFVPLWWNPHHEQSAVLVAYEYGAKVNLVGPLSLHQYFDGPMETPMDIINQLDENLLEGAEITQYEQEGREFVRLDQAAWSEPAQHMIILATILTNGEPFALSLVPWDPAADPSLTDEAIEGALEIIASAQPGPPAVPQTLAQFDAGREAIMQELEELEIIAPDSMLLFEIDSYLVDDRLQRMYLSEAQVLNTVFFAEMEAFAADGTERISCALHAREHINEEPREMRSQNISYFQSDAASDQGYLNAQNFVTYNDDAGFNSVRTTVEHGKYAWLMILVDEHAYYYVDGEFLGYGGPTLLVPGNFSATFSTTPAPNGDYCAFTNLWAYEVEPLETAE